MSEQGTGALAKTSKKSTTQPYPNSGPNTGKPSREGNVKANVGSGKQAAKGTSAKKSSVGKANAKKIAANAKGDRKSRKNPKQAGGLISRLKRRAIIVVAVLIAWPLVMTLVYKIPFIRPISNLMIYEAVFGDGARRQWVDLDEISPNLRRSVIMSEDGQFCSHHGVDWGALRDVAEDAIEGKPTRGASTLSMQLAKNLFLWNGRSYIRKGLEVPLAIWLDFVLGKKRVMEIYLNIAEWDRGKFGVEEAAQTYFGISAKDMSRRQAALLAVTLPNPKGRNAAKPTGSMSSVAKIVQRRAQRGQYYVQCVFDE